MKRYVYNSSSSLPVLLPVLFGQILLIFRKESIIACFCSLVAVSFNSNKQDGRKGEDILFYRFRDGGLCTDFSPHRNGTQPLEESGSERYLFICYCPLCQCWFIYNMCNEQCIQGRGVCSKSVPQQHSLRFSLELFATESSCILWMRLPSINQRHCRLCDYCGDLPWLCSDYSFRTLNQYIRNTLHGHCSRFIPVDSTSAGLLIHSHDIDPRRKLFIARYYV